MLAIGGAAGAASFTHVHNVAAAHGQPGWLAWADAIVLELMSIASGLELRRRKRAHTSTVFPRECAGLRGHAVSRRAGCRGRTITYRLDRSSRACARLPRHGQDRPRLRQHPDRNHHTPADRPGSGTDRADSTIHRARQSGPVRRNGGGAIHVLDRPPTRRRLAPPRTGPPSR
ncbi:DUF2637 domain-containing protein [Micromonospora sp. NPDC094482]|uniref:DUF2637 domain-containing protein n=1 Tax=Micromonospora sp. NPDC094482 TaxID=3155081 RepID=UPI00332511F6